jgi:lysophospholipid acyltransferase (LPLAT)-like uncharacterized protein
LLKEWEKNEPYLDPGLSMFLKILAFLGLNLIKILRMTYRFEYSATGLERKKRAFAHNGKNAVIYGLWHQNAMPTILAHTHQDICTLISQSSDGELIAFVCKKLGFQPVRGSSSRGGGAAKLKLVELANNGFSTAITVDGPKGPPKQSKAGIIDIAHNAQVAILGVAAIGRNYWQFNSWDKFRLPKPFSKITVSYAEPLIVEEVDASTGRPNLTKYQSLLNERLDQLQKEIEDDHAHAKRK